MVLSSELYLASLEAVAYELYTLGVFRCLLEDLNNMQNAVLEVRGLPLRDI